MFSGPVSAEYSGEFLYSFAFSFVRTFAQIVEDDAVADFSLAITLRIIGRGELIYDLVLGTKIGHLLASKVHSIVLDDGMGKPEAAHYILLEKLDHMLFGDFREWHCLNPFGEVVSG